MNNAKTIVLNVIIALSCTNLIGQLDTKTNAEQDSYCVIETPPSLAGSKNSALGDTQLTSVKLFKKVGDNLKEIGNAQCTYYDENKKAYLSSFKIFTAYRNLGLGTHLFKNTMAYLARTFQCSNVSWTAYPTADPTPQGLIRLVSFYCKAGAVDQDLNTNKKECKKMYYPLHSAQMLAVLMPILEATPLSKNDRRITFANGFTYVTSQSDPLGIIANYMGATNE